jgi:hypothetical protein
MAMCKICKEYTYSDGHRCGPSFLVWPSDQNEDDPMTVYAYGFEQAAEKWADVYDCESAEYSIAQGSPIEVFVRQGETLKKFAVTGESQPVYYATQLKDKAQK